MYWHLFLFARLGTFLIPCILQTRYLFVICFLNTVERIYSGKCAQLLPTNEVMRDFLMDVHNLIIWQYHSHMYKNKYYTWSKSNVNNFNKKIYEIFNQSQLIAIKVDLFWGYTVVPAMLLFFVAKLEVYLCHNFRNSVILFLYIFLLHRNKSPLEWF